jgi:hypothetical protein
MKTTKTSTYIVTEKGRIDFDLCTPSYSPARNRLETYSVKNVLIITGTLTATWAFVLWAIAFTL